jgi:hypothetical protein
MILVADNIDFLIYCSFPFHRETQGNVPFKLNIYIVCFQARSYSPFFTMTTEVGCTIDVSGQLKDSDNIDWYNSETDTPPLPRLATSAFLAITTGLFLFISLNYI